MAAGIRATHARRTWTMAIINYGTTHNFESHYASTINRIIEFKLPVSFHAQQWVEYYCKAFSCGVRGTIGGIGYALDDMTFVCRREKNDDRITILLIGISIR